MAGAVVLSGGSVDVPLENLASIDDEIRPLVPRAPYASRIRALRNAADELCRMSLIWQDDAAVITIQADVHTYEIPAISQGTIWRVVHATFEPPNTNAQSRRPLYPRTRDQLAGLYSGGHDYRHQFSWYGGVSDWTQRQGTPKFYLHQETSDRIRVVPIPTSTDDLGSLYLTLALIPLDTTEQLPAWILKRYRRLLRAGALADLFGMTDEAWTDQRKAADRAVEFTALLNEATAHQHTSHTTAPMSVTPRHSLDG